MTDLNRARALIFASGILWSLAGIGIKSVEAPAVTVAACRSLFAALAFAPFLIGKLQTLSWNPLLPAAALAYAGIMFTFVSATKLTYAANAIVLQYTAPMFIFLLNRAIFKSARVYDKRDYAVLAGCMAGILIIFFGQARSMHIYGIFLAMMSSVFFALYIVCVENIRDISPVVIVFVSNLSAAVIIFAFARPSLVLSRGDLTLLFFLGAFQLGLPYLLFNLGLKHIRSEEASLIVLIEPFLNPLWVAIRLGEIPPVTTFIGGGCILITLALRYLPDIRRGNGAGNL